MLIVKSKSRLAVVTGVIGVVTALAVCGGRGAKAWPDCQTCKRTLFSRMVGVTQGETVRLSAVNTVPNGSPAVVTLTFLDSSGRQFTNPQSGEALQTTLTLQPGQAGFLDLSAGTFLVGARTLPIGPPRLQLRGVVTSVPVGPASDETEAAVISALEVWDSATGRTSLLVPGGPAAIPAGRAD